MLEGRTGGWELVPSVLVPMLDAIFVVCLSPVVSVGPTEYVSPMVFVGPMVSVGPMVYIGHLVLPCATIWLEADLNGKVEFTELCFAGFCGVKFSFSMLSFMEVVCSSCPFLATHQYHPASSSCSWLITTV